MLKLELQLDGKITSVNQVYLRGKYGGVYLNPEVVQYRKDVKPKVKAAYKSCGTVYTGGPLKVNVVVYTKFYNLNGTIKRLDIDNFAKQILDSIFPAMEIDDKVVFNLSLRKVHYDKGQPYIKVKITETAKRVKKKPKASKKVTKKL